MISGMSKLPITDFLIDTVLSNIQQTQNTFWSSKSYFRLYDYLQAISFLYESGAILGRAIINKKKLDSFQRMLSSRESNEFWQNMANERLMRYIQRFNKKPETYMAFIFERLIQIATGIHPYDAWERGRFEKTLMVNNVYKVRVWDRYYQKIPADTQLGNNPHLPEGKQLQSEIRWFVREGIGFGSCFIELTEKLNNAYWEYVRSDMDRLSERLPNVSETTILSLEDEERALMKMVAFWAHECYPELLKPLCLEQYISKSSVANVENFGLKDEYENWFNIYLATSERLYLPLNYLY